MIGESHDDPLDRGGEEICAGNDDNRHPHHRKVEQPVAHRQPAEKGKRPVELVSLDTPPPRLRRTEA
jgi:hypothetical protein